MSERNGVAERDTRIIQTYTVESVAFRGGRIDVWTEGGVKLSFDRSYYMILQQPGTVFDAEWEGREITGLRINGRWAFHFAC